jgi:hypothetical protein
LAKVARLDISPEVLVMFAEGAVIRIASSELPDDVKLVQAGYDDWRRAFYVHLESATFEELPEGAVVPYLAPIRMERIS